MTNVDLPQPYLLFVGDVTQRPFAKTAIGIADWAPERCIGEFACSNDAVTTGLARMTPQEAADRGARALVIGVASIGGTLAPTWIPHLVNALESGLDVISGLHQRLSDIPELAEAATRLDRRLIDVRRPPTHLPIGLGRRRSGRRLLTVGTDCALGKKYTALALTRAFKARGIDADFRATGQTGIIIAGGGVPMDAVVSDFLAGAAEIISPDAEDNHWDVIEGQGSLFHPSYAGVSLGLLHGSQPDVIVVCHEIGRDHILGLPYELATPSLEEAIELNVRLARRTNPNVQCAGVSLNTSSLDTASAGQAMHEISAQLGTPCGDPIRGGAAFEALADACLGFPGATL